MGMGANVDFEAYAEGEEVVVDEVEETVVADDGSSEEIEAGDGVDEVEVEV